jgi:hypothetical protein
MITITFFTGKKKTDNLEVEEVTICNDCPKPDIYFIIADEYAGNKELKDLLHFDNNTFEKELINRDFHVIKNSKSNYNYTPFSIASILGMEYIEGISKQSNNLENRSISYQKINNNRLIQILKAHGYEFYNYSAFDFNDQPTLIDNEFFLTREKLITGQTLTQRLNRNVRFNLVTRFKIKSEIKNLADLTRYNNELLFKKTLETVDRKTTSPKFVFTHLFLPHYPYLFDKNGKPNPVEVLMGGNQHRQREYIEYLQYANIQLLSLVDYIQKNSSKPPIIILMGDHGFRHFLTPVDPEYHFYNLNAVYLPHKKDSLFYEGLSGVNQFRTLLNSEFRQSLPLLKDSTSFMEEY